MTDTSLTTVQKFITLVIEYDKREVDHPSEWDWDALIGDEVVTVRRVEVYGT
jgi:hypothetical protein